MGIQVDPALNMVFSQNLILIKQKLYQNGWLSWKFYGNYCSITWSFPRFFFRKKEKLKLLEILHRARSWDVETLCSSDFTNQPNWIWILSHIDLQHNDKKKTETMRDQNP